MKKTSKTKVAIYFLLMGIALVQFLQADMLMKTDTQYISWEVIKGKEDYQYLFSYTLYPNKPSDKYTSKALLKYDEKNVLRKVIISNDIFPTEIFLYANQQLQKVKEKIEFKRELEFDFNTNHQLVHNLIKHNQKAEEIFYFYNQSNRITNILISKSAKNNQSKVFEYTNQTTLIKHYKNRDLMYQSHILNISNNVSLIDFYDNNDYKIKDFFYIWNSKRQLSKIKGQYYSIDFIYDKNNLLIEKQFKNEDILIEKVNYNYWQEQKSFSIAKHIFHLEMVHSVETKYVDIHNDNTPNEKGLIYNWYMIDQTAPSRTTKFYYNDPFYIIEEVMEKKINKFFFSNNIITRKLITDYEGSHPSDYYYTYSGDTGVLDKQSLYSDRLIATIDYIYSNVEMDANPQIHYEYLFHLPRSIFSEINENSTNEERNLNLLRFQHPLEYITQNRMTSIDVYEKEYYKNQLSIEYEENKVIFTYKHTDSHALLPVRKIDTSKYYFYFATNDYKGIPKVVMQEIYVRNNKKQFAIVDTVKKKVLKFEAKNIKERWIQNYVEKNILEVITP